MPVYDFNELVDKVALRVAFLLRERKCRHGLPYQITAVEEVQPYGKGATARPLCNSCVMAAVRDALGVKVWEEEEDAG
jgi:RNA processing factor Prp31